MIFPLIRSNSLIERKGRNRDSWGNVGERTHTDVVQLGAITKRLCVGYPVGHKMEMLKLAKGSQRAEVDRADVLQEDVCQTGMTGERAEDL